MDKLIESRPYERLGLTPGRLFYEWSDEREAIGGYDIPAQIGRFKEVFNTPFEVFSYSTPLFIQLAEESPFEVPGLPEAVHLSECEVERSDWFDVEFESVFASYSREGEIDKECLQRIGAERDILENQVRRAGEQVGEIVGQAARILLPWIAEVVFVIEDDEGGSEQERELSRMVSEVAFLWDRFRKGYPLNETNVRQWISRLRHERLDPDFISGQLLGLLQFVAHRDRINNSVSHLNRRRVALEYLLHYVINDIPLPIILEKNHNRKPDGREKAPHLRIPMVKMYYQILDANPDVNPPKARYMVLEEFKEPFSDRQLQRHIQKLPRYNS